MSQVTSAPKLTGFSVDNLRQVKSCHCKNLQSNLNLAGLGHPFFCAGRSRNYQLNPFADVQTISVLSAVIMALPSFSGGSTPHPGDSTEAQPCGLSFSEVQGIPALQPLLSPAPWECLDLALDLCSGCTLLDGHQWLYALACPYLCLSYHSWLYLLVGPRICFTADCVWGY